MKKLITLVFIFANISLHAQDRDSILVQSLQGYSVEPIMIDPIVISSTRFEDRPSFNLLPAESLSLNNGYEVQNVLNQVPGVFMHSGTLSTNRITIRGIGNRSAFGTSKIRAYLEDIPLTSGIGETSLEDIDLSLIEEIEIWKGPTASRYGAGLGGMIQYRLTKPRGSGLEVNTMIGSAGTFRTSENVAIANASSGISIAHNHTGTNGWRENSQYSREGISLIARHARSNSSWLFLLNGIDLYGQIPSSIDRDDYLEDPSRAAFTWKQVEGYEDYKKFQAGLSNTRIIAPGWVVRGSIYLKGRNAYESRPFNILEESDLSYGGRFVGERIAVSWTLRAGTELYAEDLSWSTFETNSGIQGALLSDQLEDRNYINLFAEFHYRFNDRWELESGLNLNRTHYSLDDLFDGDGVDISGSYSYKWTPSPNFNLRYRPADKGIYYLNFSHGFSSPTVEETFNPEGLINEDIVQEKGWNLEAGTRGYFSDSWSYDLTFYHMMVNDLLVSRFEEDIETGFDQIVLVNAGTTRHLGMDLFTQVDIISTEASRLYLGLNYSYQHFRFLNFVEGTEDHTGNKLTGTIPHRIFATLNSELGRWSLIFTYQYQDAMPLRDDNTYFSDPYHLVNTKLTVDLMAKDRVGLQIHGGINNLFNTHYASMLLVNAAAFGNNLPRYYYPGQDLNAYAGFKLNWKFN